MNKNLILDDERNLAGVKIVNPDYDYSGEYEIVRNINDFKDYILTMGIPDFISFDHDLGSDHYTGKILPTGLDCAKWLVDYIIDSNIKILPEIQVHSMNPVGKRNILGLFDSLRKHL